MKILVLLLGITLLFGCALTLEQEVFTEIAARRLAQHIAKTHPELIVPGTTICNQILQTEDFEAAKAMLDEAIDKAMNKIGGDDPLLAADIKSLMRLLNIDMSGGWIRDLTIDTSDFDFGMLKFVAVAVKQGLNAPMVHYVE